MTTSAELSFVASNRFQDHVFATNVEILLLWPTLEKVQSKSVI